MRYALFAVCLHLFAHYGQGQQLVLGVVRDAGTREPLSGVHVIVTGPAAQGTSTNDEGFFSLQIPPHADSIRVTCIGYQSQSISTRSMRDLEILLRPFVTSLQALTVKPASPEQLIRDAVRSIPVNYTALPFQTRGFYREVIRSGPTYYSVAEAVFESQSLKKGDEALLKLVQGRRSETVKSTRIFEDYHPGGGPNFLVNHQLETEVPEFLVEKNFKDYVYTIDSITTYDGKDVYRIAFDQRDNLRKNLWSGTIFIDAESNAIINLSYSLSAKGVDYRKHLTGADKVMADLLGIDFEVKEKSIRYSYHKTGNVWSLHDAGITMDIHFRQPRKSIDERFVFQGELLAIRQETGPIKPFASSDAWQKNQLVKNLPGEFDEGFWGADNFIQPEKSMTDAVAAMDILRAEKLTGEAPEGWTLFHSSEAKAYRKDSTYMLKPFLESRWKDSELGPLLWQAVTGDFELYGRLDVSKTVDTAAAPDAGFQVGGLMLRSPQEGPENHVFLAVGCMGNPQTKIISQNTINGRSAIHVTRISTHQLPMRMRRLGNRVELHYLSPENNQWVMLREIKRDNLPSELHVGIAGFAWVPGGAPNRHPDLLIRAHGLRLTLLKP